MTAPDSGREAAVCATWYCNKCGKVGEAATRARAEKQHALLSPTCDYSPAWIEPAPAAPPPAAPRKLGVFDGPECVRCGRREVWHPDGSCHVFGAPVAAAPSGARETDDAALGKLLDEFSNAAFALGEWNDHDGDPIETLNRDYVRTQDAVMEYVTSLRAALATERATRDAYSAAARSIALNLDAFCDESLPYPEMIADAARKARATLDRLRGLLRRVLAWDYGRLGDAEPWYMIRGAIRAELAEGER